MTPKFHAWMSAVEGVILPGLLQDCLVHSIRLLWGCLLQGGWVGDVKLSSVGLLGGTTAGRLWDVGRSAIGELGRLVNLRGSAL